MYTEIFCWNVRGFNDTSHRSGFKKWIKKNKNLFGGIIKTHVKLNKVSKFVSQVLPGWSYEDNYDYSELGKIWVVWHPTVRVSIIKKSLQMITCKVLLPSASSYVIISVVYASNFEAVRKELWNEICEVSSYCGDRGSPWMVLGDFNQILDPQEHSTSISLNVNSSIRDFRDCLANSDLADLNYRGNLFTWWNKNVASPVAKKLDRILVNDDWISMFPSSFASFGAPDFSDHASAGVIMNLCGVRQKRSFKFYNFLLQNQDFLPLICLNWFSFNVVGSSMLRLSRKLKLLKKCIRSFSRDNYSNLEKRVSEAHKILLDAQTTLLADPTHTNAAAEHEAQNKWLILSKAEESFFTAKVSSAVARAWR